MQIIQYEYGEQKRKKKSMSNTTLLNKVYLDAIIDIDRVIKDSQVRSWRALKARPDFNTSFRETQKILETSIGSKVNLVILHIDIVGSTKMSLTLPIDRLTTIIGTFAQEMSLIISLYGGYVLKYIGDAVLAFFVVEDMPSSEDNIDIVDDNDSSVLQYSNVISCACTMIKVIEEGINPILNQYDYPELKVRIGIDIGKVAVVQYGLDVEEINGVLFRKPHLDLIGYTLSIAVKMTSLANPNHIVIGQQLYNRLNNRQKLTFKEMHRNPDLWSFMNQATGGIYRLYGSL